MRRGEQIDLRDSRGYLPHAGGEDSWQFVTFRLADSLPQSVLDQLGHADEPPDSSRVEEAIDRGLGSCVLVKPECAEVMLKMLLEWLSKRVDLAAWVLMPNHVHLVFGLPPNTALAPIVKTLKCRSAKLMNRLLNRSGRLWQRDYFDRQLIDSEAIETAIFYVEQNPVIAGLCHVAEDWPFSSASRDKK